MSALVRMGAVKPSIVNVPWLKSMTTFSFSRLSVPMIKSYWGFGAFSSKYIISGSNRADLDEENSGKINSMSPVSKVAKSPLDVCHLCGTNFFLAFICEFFFFAKK